ncbi:MAG: NADH-quinone oxidoreductase subunit L [Bacteroidota bacterium]|nr:NADH-quinone oxidoreductase subunit L [Bacteroidota bacterium]MDP4256014.1 NADH-quinone oxidoreductase subunit L [Bacteroidota bacterium]MDP4259407.1 NADH-quinone oxidoreductase subunit L [Bacteroidota bacterium]
MIHLVWLVPILPLAGFLLNGLLRNYLSKSLSGTIGCLTLLGSFVVSVLLFLDVKQPGFEPTVISFFDFISVGELHIPFAFQVDQLSVLFLLIITGVGFLIHLYSTSYMHDEEPPHFARYFSYLNLFVFSMLLLVLGANYVILFIGWEGVGLCSYLLIGYWFKNIEYGNAAKKAFIMNRIGDLGFLIAIFMLIQQFGTVSFDTVFSKAHGAPVHVLTAITLLLFVGATGKSAQIPLYTWLPDAMAGPTPVSALIHAATMVTAGIYMIARSNILYTLTPVTLTVVAIIGLATALLAATIALKQNDIKKVLAYSTVSQLGYMFLGLGAGAFTGSVFHVMTHAFFKALLFLGAGSVIHALGSEQDIRKMGGLWRRLPITHITFLLACFAIAGIPPFSGFFSKDEILAAAYGMHPALYVVGVLTALMTAYYMFRLYSMTFLGKFRGTPEQEHHLHESPAAMTIPLIILAILATAGGFLGIPEAFAKDSHWLAHFLAPVFEGSVSLHAGAERTTETPELLLMGISVAVALIGTIWAWLRFSRKPELGEPSGFGKLLANKWYVDELYDAVIVRPLNAVAKFFSGWFEKSVIDWIVNGVGKLTLYGSRQIRLLQSGQVGGYVLLMVVGILILFLVELFVKK